jgi:sulfur-oxidizing protein SoxY
MRPHRRHVLSLALLPVLPARATPQAMQAAIRRYTGDVSVQDARVEIDIAELVENGNTVPVTLRVASPMTAEDHVRSLALFTERNPQPEVAVFHLSRHSGRAEVNTRIRLATSQQLVALATTSDGRCWRRRVDVLVTLAACIE